MPFTNKFERAAEADLRAEAGQAPTRSAIAAFDEETLRYRSARSNIGRDQNAYRQGLKDGKKIDIHRKQIEG
jgi:hypothetical protein